MNKNFTLKKWDADTSGVCVTPHGIGIHAELYGKESNGILLYRQEGYEPVRIDFTKEMKFGSVYRCMLSGISPGEYTYLFHEDGNPVTDIWAKGFTGHRLFGEEHRQAGKKDALKTCTFIARQFDWQGDKKPETCYEDSIYYGMHVRGFTKDASSRIKEAGTFVGIQKKIPYLKTLGVTGIVLQPIYEFEECMKPRKIRTVSDAAAKPAQEPSMRLNYWGYLPGYYLAPKNAYSYSEDAVTELKTLIRQLHKNNLEVILQFYFEPSMPVLRIRDILLYWAKQYHIDGFELLGAALPLTEIALEPGLSDCKLWSEHLPYAEIESIRQARYSLRTSEAEKTQAKKPLSEKEKRLLADTGRDYQNTIRCFLKGDGGMVAEFLEQQRSNPQGYGRINYLASYNGFRLADTVSYEKKHNEANGEENRDGENENYSWNCGAEGPTKKKSIIALRKKLIKNALVMLFTAQGTPFLFMGDECGKSSGGNNNPYCQDNELTWHRWNLKKTEKELLSFTRQLAFLRKLHGVLHQESSLRLMDYLSCGSPDLSYHGKEAWRTDMDYQTRHIGAMFCGKYCMENGKEDNCLYIAYNMHWEPHEFALPKPFRNRRWKLLLDTAKEDTEKKEAGNNKREGAVSLEETVSGAASEIPGDELINAAIQSVTLPERSVHIYISEEAPKKTPRRNR